MSSAVEMHFLPKSVKERLLNKQAAEENKARRRLMGQWKMADMGNYFISFYCYLLAWSFNNH